MADLITQEAPTCDCPDADTFPEVMKPPVCAAFIGSTTDALAQDRHLNRGLPYTRVGARIRYLKADVIAYLEANRIVPGE